MTVIACHKCDLVHTISPVPEQASAYCVRCGSVLFRCKFDSINRTIAWTSAGMVLFLIAITFPFIGMKLSGIERQADLLTGIYENL
jgi:paraquat-inducible protein A